LRIDVGQLIGLDIFDADVAAERGDRSIRQTRGKPLEGRRISLANCEAVRRASAAATLPGFPTLSLKTMM